MSNRIKLGSFIVAKELYKSEFYKKKIKPLIAKLIKVKNIKITKTEVEVFCYSSYFEFPQSFGNVLTFQSHFDSMNGDTGYYFTGFNALT